MLFVTVLAPNSLGNQQGAPADFDRYGIYFINKMSAKLHVLLKYPLLVPKTPELDELEGYVNVQGHDYKIHVRNHKGRIQLLHSDFEAPDLDEHSDLMRYLDVLTMKLASSTPQQPVNATERYRRVLNEFVEFRQFHINVDRCLLSHDLETITLVTSDESGRKHRAKISTADDAFAIVEQELPDKAELSQSSSSLSIVYERFLETIMQLQPFFETMETLDNTWVLDPEQPTTKHAYRRIAVDHNVSLVVTVNPWMCNEVPQLQLLGPERLVHTFRKNISKNLLEWNSKANFVDQLLNLLEIETFLPRQVRTDDSILYTTGDCCICFSTRLEGKLPEIVCENASCEQSFHTDCLYQWLTSVGAKTKGRFEEVHGLCPNCEKHISCPIPIKT